MKLEPLNGWVIGRVAITKASSTIVLADVTKNVTKFALLEEVSPEAERAGFKPGDLVMAKVMHNIFLKGGGYHRVTFPLDEAVCRVRDVPLSEFLGSDGKPLEEAA
jgi:hypothetical protein